MNKFVDDNKPGIVPTHRRTVIAIRTVRAIQSKLRRYVGSGSHSRGVFRSILGNVRCTAIRKYEKLGLDLCMRRLQDLCASTLQLQGEPLNAHR